MRTTKELIAMENAQIKRDEATATVEPICQNCTHCGDKPYLMEAYIDGKPVVGTFYACKATPFSIDARGVAIMVQEHSGCQFADDPQFVPHHDVVALALELGEV